MAARRRDMSAKFLQEAGYRKGIAADFVLHLSKMKLNQYRSSNTGKSGPGGI
jgi:hypothetical protein